MDYIDRLLDFIEASPTGYQAVEACAAALDSAGFSRLSFGQRWELEPGKGYYAVENQSSLAAFRIPGSELLPFAIAESHCDSPALRIKRTCEVKADRYLKLNCEIYGGPILSSWLDRPLTAAGRVTVRRPGGVSSRTVDFKRPLFVIPSLAPHLNPEANSGYRLTADRDMQPLLGSAGDEGGFIGLLARECGCGEGDILAYDLYAVSAERGFRFGSNGEFVAAPRLDNLSNVFASMGALISCRPSRVIPVSMVFNKEEIGSTGRDGADSTVLLSAVEGIAEGLNAGTGDLRRAVAGSFALSCDNGHGVHPNFPDKSDPADRCLLNGGVMIKQSPAYATDGFSAGVFAEICSRAGVPVQFYSNRADMRGGSTLGNISIAHLSVPTVDIGIPQLAMHSTMETAGARDPELMERAMDAFFSTSLRRSGDSGFDLC